MRVCAEAGEGAGCGVGPFNGWQACAAQSSKSRKPLREKRSGQGAGKCRFFSMMKGNERYSSPFSRSSRVVLMRCSMISLKRNLLRFLMAGSMMPDLSSWRNMATEV